MKPTIGRIVIYKSKIDNGPGNDVYSPAVVIRTRETCVEAVAKRWGPEPSTVVSASDPSVTHQTASRPSEVVDVLPDDDTVDLLVHGLGKDYREYNVAKGDGFGQWQWPSIEKAVTPDPHLPTVVAPQPVPAPEPPLKAEEGVALKPVRCICQGTTVPSGYTQHRFEGTLHIRPGYGAGCEKHVEASAADYQ